MRYLVDTSVLSEARKPRPNAGVLRWFSARVMRDLAVSVLTLLELEVGCQRLQRRDKVAAAHIRKWLDSDVYPGFEGRILEVDVRVIQATAPLHVPDPMPEHDAILAGTAVAHGLTVVTRNVKHFARAGVRLVDPWAE
ncbi:MAG: type II toxin-antitoxin system VapC family toxin [Bifidobacteriaceae bacterium]|jgi:predicted nucleic acid-binding protein|nr:type II toxin-antitoxin system VapC family toxin [Bifidobacteriaceae bacterium]